MLVWPASGYPAAGEQHEGERGFGGVQHDSARGGPGLGTTPAVRAIGAYDKFGSSPSSHVGVRGWAGPSHSACVNRQSTLTATDGSALAIRCWTAVCEGFTLR